MKRGIRFFWLFYLLPMGSLAGVEIPISVFVSIPPQKYFVEQVGGPYVKVSVMVGPGQSPATYDPTPRQLLKLSQAQAYFLIGVPFESTWIKRAIAVNPQITWVDTSQGITLRSLAVVHRSAVDSSVEPGKDPHIWTSPPLVEVQARTIRDALIDIDPEHRRDYDLNYRRFIDKLKTLDHEIRNQFRDLKDPKIMVFHPSWGYFADTYGLRLITIELLGKEPGAKQLTKVMRLAKAEDIRVIFVQKQFSQQAAKAVANAIGARLVAVDPLSEDYIDNLKQVSQAFAQAMRSQ